LIDDDNTVGIVHLTGLSIICWLVGHGRTHWVYAFVHANSRLNVSYELYGKNPRINMKKCTC